MDEAFGDHRDIEKSPDQFKTQRHTQILQVLGKHGGGLVRAAKQNANSNADEIRDCNQKRKNHP